MAFNLSLPSMTDADWPTYSANIRENFRAITQDSMTIGGTKIFSGNVGFGGTPVGPLHVIGTADSNIILRVQNTDDAGASADATLRAISGNAGVARLEFSDTGAFRAGIYGLTNDSLSFRTGGSLTERASIDANGNVVVGTAALTTTATNGFFYFTTGAGAPTGTPTAFTGRVPIYYDTTNNRIYVYNGAWKSVLLA